MKFLQPTKPDTSLTRYSGYANLEAYIDNTKQGIVVDNMLTINQPQPQNLSEVERASLNKLQQARQEITIKPADKNLGIVLLDTKDYISQCLKHWILLHTAKQQNTLHIASVPNSVKLSQALNTNSQHSANGYTHTSLNRKPTPVSQNSKNAQTVYATPPGTTYCVAISIYTGPYS